MSKMIREFLVQGSETDPYTVVFEKEGTQLKGSCTCRAGIFGQLCKHRLALLDGVADAVVSNNLDQVGEVASWLPGSNLAAALSDLTALERQKASIEAQIKRAKKVVAQELMH
jgi:uncharacterized Zn finger protein